MYECAKQSKESYFIVFIDFTQIQEKKMYRAVKHGS